MFNETTHSIVLCRFKIFYWPSKDPELKATLRIGFWVHMCGVQVEIPDKHIHAVFLKVWPVEHTISWVLIRSSDSCVTHEKSASLSMVALPPKSKMAPHWVWFFWLEMYNHEPITLVRRMGRDGMSCQPRQLESKGGISQGEADSYGRQIWAHRGSLLQQWQLARVW